MEDIVGKKVRLKSEEKIREEIRKGNRSVMTLHSVRKYIGQVFTVLRRNMFDPNVIYVKEDPYLVFNYHWIESVEPTIPEDLFYIEE